MPGAEGARRKEVGGEARDVTARAGGRGTDGHSHCRRATFYGFILPGSLQLLVENKLRWVEDSGKETI